MRGFGAVQTCYAIESSMDKLAGALAIDPLRLRQINALEEGSMLPTGQPVDGPAPLAEMLEYLADLPMPDPLAPGADLRTLPGGVSNTTHGEGIARGVGYALGMKAIGLSGGVDDYSTARVSVSAVGGSPLAEVYAHPAFAYAAHRAVVDVDRDLGLVRVVELATVQDVGKAMNPQAVEGQIEGGSAQGVGLALLEELQIVDGVIKNPSFMDYLIPTILDMPPMSIRLFEFPHPDSPYGLNGVGEPPTLSSTPAIVNALRDATGLDLPRAPVRPADLIATMTTNS